MSPTTALSRLADYYRRHGMGATARRAGLALKRTLVANNTVLFYCDLPTQAGKDNQLPVGVAVERKKSAGELQPSELEAITAFWNPEIARRNISERFLLGASLWLLRSEGELAGFGWTLRGSTVEPHFFPLDNDDVHMFDFHVFPQYRGQGLNPLLVVHILRSLASEASGRALIEAAEWNQPQLASLAKTPLRRLGSARKLVFGDRALVWWPKSERRYKIIAERAEAKAQVVSGPEATPEVTI